MSENPGADRFWWEREDLRYESGRLHFAGHDLAALAGAEGTPVFVYSAARVLANLERLRGVLAAQSVRHRVFYALKANRFAPLLARLQQYGACGIDASSPGEVRHALQSGFAGPDIVFTGNSVSNADLEYLQRHPGVRVNCDAISTIRRLGKLCPGRSIGIRINLQGGLGYHEGMRYAGEKPSKFGVYADRFEEALQVAQQHRMKVTTLHFHSGGGYLSNQIDEFAGLLERTEWFFERAPDVDTLDVGGGLGVPLAAGEQPLDLARWSEVVADHARRHNLEIHVEPGDFLVKDAGVLLLEVNTVETRGGTEFVGVNGGLNLLNLAAYYALPQAPAAVRLPTDAPARRVTIAGNINEGVDLFAQDVLLPPFAEGDLLALLNAGGYAAASSSNHCMRGTHTELLL